MRYVEIEEKLRTSRIGGLKVFFFFFYLLGSRVPLISGLCPGVYHHDLQLSNVLLTSRPQEHVMNLGMFPLIRTVLDRDYMRGLLRTVRHVPGDISDGGRDARWSRRWGMFVLKP